MDTSASGDYAAPVAKQTLDQSVMVIVKKLNTGRTASETPIRKITVATLKLQWVMQSSLWVQMLL